MIKLADVKKYLRVAHDEDDNYIESIITMVTQLIEEQTGVEDSTNDYVYKMAILQGIAHFYDKRESFSEKSQVTVPYTLDCLIKHIAMRGALKQGCQNNE